MHGLFDSRPGHIGTALRDEFDDLFMRHARQNFSNSRPARTEDFGQPLFNQFGAGVQAVFDNGCVNPLVDLILCVLAFKTGGHRGFSRAGGRHSACDQ
ncbi:hypothetical protein D9M68_795330 [compost metagenome]